MYKSNSSIFSNYNIWLNAVKNDKKTFNELKSIGVGRGLKRSRQFESCFSKNRSKCSSQIQIFREVRKPQDMATKKHKTY